MVNGLIRVSKNLTFSERKQMSWPRFQLVVDTAGGFFTALWSDDWKMVLLESEKWNPKKIMYVNDKWSRLTYHFNQNVWTMTGRTIGAKMSITQTLRELNWHKGRGRVSHIIFDQDDRTKGTVYRRVHLTTNKYFIEKRRFSIKGDVLRAFGGSVVI